LRQADFDRTFDISSFILNPPDLLKLKEPLFKLSVSGNATKEQHENNIFHDINKVGDLIFSKDNLNFELNMRSNKIISDRFIEFAQSWVYLSFDKYSKNIMDRYFGMHNIKLILDYDRPMPDTSSVLFDLKNIMVLMRLEVMSNSLYGGANGYANAISRNQSASNMNIFQCNISLNKLCAMLIEWTDIMLVENCVYLKFLTSSLKYLKSNGIKTKQLASETKIQSTNNASHSKFDLKSNKNEADNLTQETCNSSGPKVSAQKESDLNGSNSANRSSKSKSQRDSSSKSTTSTKQGNINNRGETNGSNDDSNNNDDSNGIINNSNTTIFGSKCDSNNSFVIIRLETQHVPYVSIQFCFHSSINYHDRIRLLEIFNAKLRELNLKSQPSQQWHH
jgi:hypothetical protein